MIEALSLLILLLLSGFFSGSETALVTLSRGRADSLAAANRRGGSALQLLKSNPQEMLVAILIGNNLVNISATALATVIATREFGSLGPGLAVGILTVVILVFGEITPKSLATRYSERISLFVAPIILGIVYITKPISSAISYLTPNIHSSNHIVKEDPVITESELITMASYGEEEGTIDESEKQLIERAFAFSDLSVSDVMTPRHNVFCVSTNTKINEILDKISNNPFSRIPIHSEDPDEIIGMLHVRDLIQPIQENNLTLEIGKLGKPCYFVPENQSLTEAVTALRQERHQLAVVVDEHGVMEGVVSIEDLIEELVGEIYDESDVAPNEVIVHDPSNITVEGHTELRILTDHFNVSFSGKPTDSVSKWILDHIQRIPTDGEVFIIEDFNVKVLRATSRKINRLLISNSTEPL